jgi:PPOX class probable F420-dependent enzyme
VHNELPYGSDAGQHRGVDIDAALRFAAENHRAVLATRRRDGSPQLSPVALGVEDDKVVISSRETAIKVKNLRRDPRASVCVMNDAFYGPWVQLDGTAEIVSLPDAMDGLIAYYRQIAGEHPDWGEYRVAMARERRVLIRIAPERAGPNVSG